MNNNTVADLCSFWYKCLWIDNNNSYWFTSFNRFGSQVNTNGIISFQIPFTEFIPQRFPLNYFIPLIAPFWDDVDIRRFGNIFFRETSNTTLLQRACNQLQELFSSSDNFTPTTLFIATWDRVPSFAMRSQVSAYMTALLLVSIPTHCNNAAWRSKGNWYHGPLHMKWYGGLLHYWCIYVNKQ